MNLPPAESPRNKPISEIGHKTPEEAKDASQVPAKEFKRLGFLSKLFERGEISKTSFETPLSEPQKRNLISSLSEAVRKTWDDFKQKVGEMWKNFIKSRVSKTAHPNVSSEAITGGKEKEQVSSIDQIKALSPEEKIKKMEVFSKYFEDKKVLDEEGIFRLSGSKEVIDSLLATIPKEDFSLELLQSKDPNAVAGAFKQFIEECRLFGDEEVYKELKDVAPLIEIQDRRVNTEKEESKEKLLETLRFLAIKSPEKSKLLHSFLDILGRVSEQSAQNKMTPENLAKCVTPRLLSDSDKANQEIIRETTKVVELMIEKKDDIKNLFV